MSATLLAAAAHRLITPPLGSQMAGFDARKGTATTVHDPLHARALVLDDGLTQVALLSLELIGVDAEWTGHVRTRIAHNTGIPAANIVIAATHTHCGPVTFHHFFNQGQPLDTNYLNHLADETVAAAQSAFHHRRPATLQAGIVRAESIAVNRRTATGEPADHNAGVILVQTVDGAPVAVLVQFSCHPTVLGPNTLSITADFPYFTGALLRRELGDDVEVLFFNGAEGDISVGHRSNLSAVGVIAPFRTFEKAQELGERLGRAVAAGLPTLQPQHPHLAVARHTARLPLKSYPQLTEVTKRRQLAEQDLQTIPPGESTPELLLAKQGWLFARIEEYYARLYYDAPGEDNKTLPAHLTAVRIGNVALLSFPGEVFCQIASAIRQSSPFPITLFLGLANDYVGYIPTADASADSGYEVIASRVAPEAANILMTESNRLLRALANSHSE